MKQKDIALVVVVVFISALLSFFVSKALFASPQKRQQTAEIVQPITSTFTTPDTHYYNKDAFDPTQPITIQQNGNTTPFSSTSQ